MLALLWVALCFASSCKMERVETVPLEMCESRMGAHLAAAYAQKRGLYLKAWSCQVERSV